MTTLDEMCKTYAATWGDWDKWDHMPPGERQIARQGMITVIEKHFKPMIAEAYQAGLMDELHGATPHLDYTARIVAALGGVP